MSYVESWILKVFALMPTVFKEGLRRTVFA
jgi:hypothetical protein